jgi:hypothetical protein
MVSYFCFPFLLSRNSILYNIPDSVFPTFLPPQDIDPKYLGNIAFLCRECSPEVQSWWAKYLEDLLLPPSIVLENMHLLWGPVRPG